MMQIEVQQLTKRFGDLVAVNELDFTVQPGRVTGFLGPNGSGKTTTMRMMLGLSRPTSGAALFDGRPYHDLEHPVRTVGALVDPSTFHPGRTARQHLEIIAVAAGFDRSRVQTVLELVDLAGAANRKAGTFSMGMAQRLGLAAALLGDPQVLILDEPLNGLDPDGIIWLRHLLTDFAAAGRTVLLSSHLLTEVAHTVDDVVVIAHGRLVAAAPLAQLQSRVVTVVHTPQVETLIAALLANGLPARRAGADEIRINVAAAATVGAVATRESVDITGLVELRDDLEAMFTRLTSTNTNPNTPKENFR